MVPGTYFSQDEVSDDISMVSDGILHNGDNQKFLCSSNIQRTPCAKVLRIVPGYRETPLPIHRLRQSVLKEQTTPIIQ